MTGRPLLAVGWLAVLGLVAAALTAYLGGGFQRHFFLAVGSVALVLVAHLTLFLYLLRCRRAIAELVAASGLKPEFARAAREQPRRLTPWLGGVVLALAAAVVAGGAAYTNALPLWVHQVLIWLAIAAQAGAVGIESRVMAEHRALVAAINARLTA